MCGIGQVLQTGFQIASNAAQSSARIKEQNRQYAANKEAANASFEASRDTTSLQFIQRDKSIRQQELDYDLLARMSLANAKAQVGASNLGGTSIKATLADAKGRYDRNARRFIEDRKNLAAAYQQDLINLEVTRENQINTVMQGRWTAGDTMNMLAPLAGGFSNLMIQRDNRSYYQNQMNNIGMLPSMGATPGGNNGS